jgi:hypothetical protein
MDIGMATYNGIPLNWYSGTGYVESSYFEPEDFGWLRSFHGGLLTTCGLTYLGKPCVDNGKKLGLHGRISNIPAKNICLNTYWEKDDYILSVKGEAREISVFGENVCLRREITVRTGEPRLFIHDEIENMGYSEVEHMILYHFNLGYPIVDEGSKLISKTKELIPRDKEAELSKEDYNRFTAPIKNFKEKVYYHKMESDKNGFVTTALVNEQFCNGQGIVVYLKYSIKELPFFVEWKMVGEGVYVVGLEPGNCLVEGRDKEREAKRLKYLMPGEIKKYNLELGVINSKKEIIGLVK